MGQHAPGEKLAVVECCERVTRFVANKSCLLERLELRSTNEPGQLQRSVSYLGVRAQVRQLLMDLMWHFLMCPAGPSMSMLVPVENHGTTDGNPIRGQPKQQVRGGHLAGT